MGNAGTAMRLFTGLLSAQKFDSQLIGDASLMKRPMERVAKPLRAMGADVRTHNGTPPVDIGGVRGLHGIDYQMPMASAQVKSAILLAALYARSRHHHHCAGRQPRSQRAHAAELRGEAWTSMACASPCIRRSDSPASGSACPAIFRPPPSSSSPDFWRRRPEGLLIQNVGLNPTRIGLLTILRRMGANIEILKPRESGAEPVADLRVFASPLHGIPVPKDLVSLAIDELPVLFIAAACAEGETWVTGAEELRVKESDRIAAMSAGLAALGVAHTALPDGMRIQGRGQGAAFASGEIDSFGDHRIAMSFAVASLRAAGVIGIRDVANVATSFPGFVQLARSVGLALSESAD